jgi:hypothetical protein
MEYRLLVDLEVIEVMDRMPKAQRRRFLALFDRLRAFPSNYSDYHEADAVGRRWKSVSFRPGRSTTGLMALIGM